MSTVIFIFMCIMVRVSKRNFMLSHVNVTHSCVPTLVPLHVTKGCDCIHKNKEKTVVPTMSVFFVWYLKC